eukprot:384698_1
MFCSLPIYFLLYTYGIICIVFITIVIYTLYTFIVKETTKNMNRKIKYLVLSFLITTVLSIFLNIPFAFSQCYLQELKLYIAYMWMPFWSSQSFLLLIIFFYKLIHVFMKTQLRVRNTTEKIYKLCFIALPLYAVLVLCLIFPLQLLQKAPLISMVLFIGCILSYILLSISMIILFTHKLTQTYKQSVSDESIITAITKLTLLTTISITFTFIDGILSAAVLGVSTDSKYHIWIDILSDYATVLDTFTNFCCVVLTFQSFKRYYIVLCGCCEFGCRCCVQNMLQKDTLEKNMANVIVASKSTVV